jgi:serine phosphatase RsbU (regulator of sigma subunit)
LGPLCDVFERVTGWSLCYRPVGNEPVDAIWSRKFHDADRDQQGCLTMQPEDGQTMRLADSTMGLCDEQTAQELASSVADVLEELFQTRCALWQREAELAAGVPITASRDGEAHLAVRLEAVLKAAAKSVGCQAAAVYLLDEGTRKLKLRSSWGLPQSRFIDSPRPLRGAAADLEALVGHAVVLEDATQLAHWKIPEEFSSAVCVPVSSPTTPFGTLWMFCDRVREFSVDETNLMEIVAGRVAAELEREMLLQQTLDMRRMGRQLSHAMEWQKNHMPRIKPLLEGWRVAGWTAQADSLGGDFHDWFVLPDGRLAVAVGDAQGKMFEASLTAASLQTALKSHANYRHSVRTMAERINETLWTASVGDQFASLFYAMIQPKTGRMEFVTAGHMGVVLVNESLRELATDETLPLGTQPDADYPAARHDMLVDDVLVVLSDGAHRSLSESHVRVLLRLIQSNRREGIDQLVERARNFLQRHAVDRDMDDRTLLLVKRTGPTG